MNDLVSFYQEVKAAVLNPSKKDRGNSYSCLVVRRSFLEELVHNQNTNLPDMKVKYTEDSMVFALRVMLKLDIVRTNGENMVGNWFLAY